MKNSQKTLKIAVVFALIFALSFTLLASCKKEENDPAETTESVSASKPTPDSQTKAPETTVAPGTTLGTTDNQGTATPGTTVSPGTTSAPVTTVSPETTKPPVTTETPGSETVPPVVAPSASGSFAADTGTSLGYRLDWALKGFEGDQAVIEYKVVISTYQLILSSRKNLGIISLNGTETRFSTERIEVTGEGKTDVVIHEGEVKVKTVDGKATFELTAKWFFNGNYTGVDYEWLTAGGFISVQK